MGMGAFLAVDGFFDQIEFRLVTVARTPPRLLGWVVWGSGVLSAFITNDAVCVLCAPLVVRLIQRHRLPALSFLLALATAANTGSVATLVGNPQNMLAGLLGDLSYRSHLLLMAPVAVLGLAINHGVLFLAFRGALAQATLARREARDPIIPGRAILSLAVIVATGVVYLLGAHLGWTAAAGFVVLMLVHRRDTRLLWPEIDWSLLLFFAGLFVVVEGLNQSGAPALMFERFPLSGGEGAVAWFRLSAIFLAGSNIVSNVPFILIVRDHMATLADPTAAWELLAMASTFAGNLTLLGSVANIIVAEAGRDVGGIGFWQYLRIGAPVAVLTTLMGTLWIVLAMGLG